MPLPVPALKDEAHQNRDGKSHLVFHLALQQISLFGLYVLLFVLIVLAAEVGAVFGRRISAAGGDDKDATTLATASLGLLALLIAFTYSLALQRYDNRRQDVLAEANAIGSTANFALMLPAANQKPVLDLLKRYTALRIGLGAPFDRAKFAQDNADTTRLQGELWQQAVAVTAAQPQSLPAYRFVASLNEVNNIGEKRLTALRNHVPVVVELVLIATALVAMGFTGYSAGLAGAERRIGTALISLVLSLLIMLTVDLDRPDRGTIRVPTQALADALAAIPSSAGPPQTAPVVTGDPL